jgi:hypothetical protein
MTETYIKSLEKTIEHLSQNLDELQQKFRTTHKDVTSHCLDLLIQQSDDNFTKLYEDPEIKNIDRNLLIKDYRTISMISWWNDSSFLSMLKRRYVVIGWIGSLVPPNIKAFDKHSSFKYECIVIDHRATYDVKETHDELSTYLPKVMILII